MLRNPVNWFYQLVESNNPTSCIEERIVLMCDKSCQEVLFFLYKRRISDRCMIFDRRTSRIVVYKYSGLDVEKKDCQFVKISATYPLTAAINFIYLARAVKFQFLNPRKEPSKNYNTLCSWCEVVKNRSEKSRLKWSSASIFERPSLFAIRRIPWRCLPKYNVSAKIIFRLDTLY